MYVNFSHKLMDLRLVDYHSIRALFLGNTVETFLLLNLVFIFVGITVETLGELLCAYGTNFNCVELGILRICKSTFSKF